MIGEIFLGGIEMKRWLLILVFLIPALAFPDKGMMPIIPGVSVYEPGQKAIVAWKDGKEVMILSTDVRATKDTEVLEVIPFPSPPDIQEGNFDSFLVIQKLILFRMPILGKGEGYDVEVLFHERIGAHDILLCRVNDWDDFMRWVEEFLKGAKISPPPRLEEVLRGYLDDGMRYFVFDRISIASEERSVDPIIYKFASDFPYYPLKISTIIPGDTDIKLFLITELPLTAFYKEGVGEMKLVKTIPGAVPVVHPLSNRELWSISGEIGSLFEGEAWLSFLRYRGKLETLREDFRAESFSMTTDVSSENLAESWGKIKTLFSRR